MRVWYYGANSYHKTAHVVVDEAPWYIFLLDRVVEWICGMVPCIPLPKIKMELKDADDIRLLGRNITTWKDWYGDTSQWFCLSVHMPVFHYCNRKTKRYILPVSYNKLRKLFREVDKEYWDFEAAIGTESTADEKSGNDSN